MQRLDHQASTKEDVLRRTSDLTRVYDALHEDVLELRRKLFDMGEWAEQGRPTHTEAEWMLAPQSKTSTALWALPPPVRPTAALCRPPMYHYPARTPCHSMSCIPRPGSIAFVRAWMPCTSHVSCPALLVSRRGKSWRVSFPTDPSLPPPPSTARSHAWTTGRSACCSPLPSSVSACPLLAVLLSSLLLRPALEFFALVYALLGLCFCRLGLPCHHVELLLSRPPLICRPAALQQALRLRHHQRR